MGMFDFLKKKPEPEAAPEPVKYKLVLNDLELSEGFPRLTRYEIQELEKEEDAIIEQYGYSMEEEGAFDAYLELAKKGYPRAMLEIANAYFSGEGAVKNYQEHCRWLYRSAYFGHAFAMVELAEEYALGWEDEDVIYFEKDPVKEFFWYQKAANQEIYYVEYDDDDEEYDEEEEEDDDLTDEDAEEYESEPYSPNKDSVEQAQAKVEEIIASIKNGTFEGTQEQAQKILEMHN